LFLPQSLERTTQGGGRSEEFVSGNFKIIKATGTPNLCHVLNPKSP
jgi:hypothetical protein